jgi:ribosomal protein S18 acetylase RimI-like enzyme
MEFKENLTDYFKARSNGIVKILPFHVTQTKLPSDTLVSILDTMGNLSALAQGLHIPITSASSFGSSEYTIYMKVDGQNCIGFIKTGYKNLYIRDLYGGMVNIRPLCILDFYVHETCQREGHGKSLFDHVLKEENIEPHRLAYDRPSPKFLSFLRKYFNLREYYPQNNNFVVYSKYFEEEEEKNQVIKTELPPPPAMTGFMTNLYGKPSSSIASKQRRGSGVFSALGKEVVQGKNGFGSSNFSRSSTQNNFAPPLKNKRSGLVEHSQSNFHK